MTDHAKHNAASWAEEIERMIDALTAAQDADDTDAQEAAEREIGEAPLSVRVRDDWRDPNDDASDPQPVEYEILLSTGGPGLRIWGEIGRHGEPDSARLEWQDWGTPWTYHHETTEKQDAALLVFASRFIIA